MEKRFPLKRRYHPEEPSSLYVRAVTETLLDFILVLTYVQWGKEVVNITSHEKKHEY